MNEKEIIELMAGLNAEALEAFKMYMQYKYIELFVEAGAMLSVVLGGGWLLGKGTVKLFKDLNR